METGGPEASGGGRPGREVDIAVWLLVIAALIGLAAAVAWFLSNAVFAIREITYSDAADFEVLIPVAPAPESSPLKPPAPDPAPKGPSTAGGPDAGLVLPKWTRQPAPLYPDLALSRGIDRGDVTLRCEALASGELGACEILRESPPNAGFGEAALASIREARVQPRSIDGFRTDSRIAFTMRFRMAPEP